MLFAKSPALQRVKTRLSPPLTPAQALALHEAMLVDQIAFLRALGTPTRRIEVRLDAPEVSGAAGAALEGIAVRAQGDGDLGTRMRRAALDAFAGGAARIGMLGGDAPTLPGDRVEEALSRVRGPRAAAIVPAPDGGYVFLALSPGALGLLDGISWGEASVVADTRTRARTLGVALAETAPWGDVDTGADLPRLAAEIENDPARAPATRAALAALRLDVGRGRMV